MNVLALVPYPTLGASNRLRVEQYAPLLAREGVHLDVSPFLGDGTYRILYTAGHAGEKLVGVGRGLARRLGDLARARRYDLVLIHRESSPLPYAVIERLLRLSRAPFVLDFDDAIFLESVHPSNRRWRWLRRPRTVIDSARRAAGVIVGNEYLASFAREWNAHVSILPTPVDTRRHAPAPQRDHDDVVIGWVGSSTTAPYLRLVDGPLGDLGADPSVRIRVVGGDYSNDRIARLEILPYDLRREPADLQGMDIGILPEPNDAWTKGKGAFKALLYMATGLPVIASAVGVNGEIVEHGVTGLLVETADEWREALRALTGDPALRARMGRAGRERVSRWSVEAQAPKLAAILRSAAR